MSLLAENPAPAMLDATVRDMEGSHRITRRNGKVRVHGLEVFMAFDPRIDNGKADPQVARWSNDRLRAAIETTRQHMERGSNPQFVVLHDSSPDAPVSPESVGSMVELWYEERDGVGYAVCDAEFSAENFAHYLESNRYPRRSAEFWKDNDHMSEVALLGRETPRRPLPDTHFARAGQREFFGKTRFAYAGVGGGGNTFVPATGRKHEMSIDERIEKIEGAVAEMAKKMAKLCNEMPEDKTKDENAKPAPAPEAKPDGDFVTRAELNSALEALAATKAEMAKAQAEARKEKFTRVVETLRAEGVAIKDEDAPKLAERIASASDPDAEVEWVKANFQRLPVRQEIPVRYAALPQQKVSPEEIRAKAEEFAKTGDSEGFRKWMNERQSA